MANWSHRHFIALLTAWVVGYPTIIHADNPPAANNPAAAPIVVSGAVPDESTKNAILTKVRGIYGADRVVDQLTVGGVAAPANWALHVQQAIVPNLKTVKKGLFSVTGNNVALRGEVTSDDEKQQVSSAVQSALHATYNSKLDLKVVQPTAAQGLLDNVLANRIVEFESGSSKLTPAGTQLLDEMAAAMAKVGNKKVEIIGHTDGKGNRDSNLKLSLARAEAVKSYLVQKGIPGDNMTTEGLGPDRPIAPNNTDDGRRRNRRIEFHVLP
ncbi:OOP family OmpA-OmpF porin [Chitinivorax tropicus]|uniref:OOP family OmpA-OmpF porin n=1 Tax=Chitinivorax tropicus TaxID=714531 RepID=A0A840MR78_9PROT|nr:OmpA family protein [Chitinivorax tropicus]MBB5017721.1 OOP family OmpA-OmpF porin [Chitinivorax tropicus]